MYRGSAKSTALIGYYWLFKKIIKVIPMLRRKELLMIVLAQIAITLLLTSVKPHQDIQTHNGYRHSLLNDTRIYLP